jgi:hypothetical protein
VPLIANRCKDLDPIGGRQANRDDGLNDPRFGERSIPHAEHEAVLSASLLFIDGQLTPFIGVR